MSNAFNTLRATIAALRHPVTGCPWDLKQTHASLARYALEESYELVDAITWGDLEHLREELGDVLLQVVLHARLAEEAGHFDLDDVANGIREKMVRRHPHVFADVNYADEAAQKADWEHIKQSEKVSMPGRQVSLLDSVPLAMPALARAQKLQKNAATVGFDWGEAEPVYAKILEELEEVRDAARLNEGAARIHEELGDLLFAVVNLVRHYGGDAEEALRKANDKFSSRFRFVEQRAYDHDRRPEQCTLEEMELWWEESKAAEK